MLCLLLKGLPGAYKRGSDGLGALWNVCCRVMFVCYCRVSWGCRMCNCGVLQVHVKLLWGGVSLAEMGECGCYCRVPKSTQAVQVVWWIVGVSAETRSCS